VICTLGNFATKLLRGDPAGITRVHGRPRCTRSAPTRPRLYPIYHPAAALYTPRTMETLREDFLALPGVLGLPPAAPSPAFAAADASDAADAVGPVEPVEPVEPVAVPVVAPEQPGSEQLGLF